MDFGVHAISPVKVVESKRPKLRKAGSTYSDSQLLTPVRHLTAIRVKNMRPRRTDIIDKVLYL